MKRTALILVLLLVISLLCACAETPPPATTAPPLPTETTVPTDATIPPETTVPVETTLPPETTVPSESMNEFAEYEALLEYTYPERNWLLNAIGCVFSKPEEIALNFLFYGGFGEGSWDRVSEESEQYLIDQGFWREMDIQPMPREKLDETLQSTFGVSLADMTIPDEWVYLEKEDLYCSNHNDAYFPGIPQITAVEDDGTTIVIHYTIDSYYNTATDEFLDFPDLVLTLMRQEDGTVHAISNVLAPEL